MIHRIIIIIMAIMLLPGAASAQNRRARDVNYYKQKYRKDNNIVVEQPKDKQPAKDAKKEESKKANPLKQSSTAKKDEKPVKPTTPVEVAIDDTTAIDEDGEIIDTLAIDTLPPEPKFITVKEEVVVENPITREIAITIVEKQVEVTDDMDVAALEDEEDEDTDEIPSKPSMPASGTSGGKYNPFKTGGGSTPSAPKHNPFTGKKSNQLKGGSAKAGTTNDKLRLAYTATNLSASPSAALYSFRSQPESPLAAELFEQNQSAGELNMGGRWATTLRNSSTLREMLIVDVDATTKQVKVTDGSDMSKLQAANPRWKGSYTVHTVEEKALNLKYEYSFQAQDANELGMFVAKLIQPYCGTLVTTNPGQFKQLAALEDVPIKVDCTLSMKLKPAKSSLHGTMSLKCTATAQDNTVQVFTLSLPCTMYRAAASYSGFDESEVKTIDYAAADTVFARGLLAKTSLSGHDYNNLGYCYLNGFGVTRNLEKALSHFEMGLKKGCPEAYANLYLMYRNGWGCESKDFFKALSYLEEGRHAHSVAALTISADLMLVAPKSNPADAYQWFSECERAKSNYAILRLGQMVRAGEGVAKNEDASLGFFSRSKDKDAFYEQAKLQIKEKKWTAVFNTCKEGASMGSTKCMQTLAEMFLMGIGTRQDFKSGKRWLTKLMDAKKNELKGYRHDE